MSSCALSAGGSASCTPAAHRGPRAVSVSQGCTVLWRVSLPASCIALGCRRAGEALWAALLLQKRCANLLASAVHAQHGLLAAVPHVPLPHQKTAKKGTFLAARAERWFCGPPNIVRAAETAACSLWGGGRGDAWRGWCERGRGLKRSRGKEEGREAQTAFANCNTRPPLVLPLLLSSKGFLIPSQQLAHGRVPHWSLLHRERGREEGFGALFV